MIHGALICYDVANQDSMNCLPDLLSMAISTPKMSMEKEGTNTMMTLKFLYYFLFRYVCFPRYSIFPCRLD